MQSLRPAWTVGLLLSVSAGNLSASGADFLARDALLSSDAADTLKAEAKARVEAGRFFGFILYVSLLATKRRASAS